MFLNEDYVVDSAIWGRFSKNCQEILQLGLVNLLVFNLPSQQLAVIIIHSVAAMFVSILV